MMQYNTQNEKSARTLTVITPCKAVAAARGKEVRCRSLSPVGEKQVITPCKAIATARGKANRHQPMNSVGVQHLPFMCIFPAPLTTNLLYYLFRPPAAVNVLNLKVFTAAGVHLFLKKEKEFYSRTTTPFSPLPLSFIGTAARPCGSTLITNH